MRPAWAPVGSTTSKRRSASAATSSPDASTPSSTKGLLRRVEYQQHPPRNEYRLTDKGRDAYPILAAMAAWGDRWLTGPEGTPLVLHHTACDHDMHAVVVCSECAEPIDVREVRATPGPGADVNAQVGAS